MNIKADRIFIQNGSGYVIAEPQLISAIESLGHKVVVSYSPNLPVNFTSKCVDSINGFDWLCFFGNTDYSYLIPQIKAFLDVGGKIFYQYDVGVSLNSSFSYTKIITEITGLKLTLNSNNYIAFTQISIGGWEADNISCCCKLIGDAFQGLDGIPENRQFKATKTLNNALPPINTCLNFGCFFYNSDFIGSANRGAIVGIGDIQIWYDGDEPFWNGGTTPVNMSVVNYFFPNDTSNCYLFPPGCFTTINHNFLSLSLGEDTTLCNGDRLELNANQSNATYLWQDNSNKPDFIVNQSGTYWVEVKQDSCIVRDTVKINFVPAPKVNLGLDRAICDNENFYLDVSNANASYLWQDNSTLPTFTISEPGKYWVQVSLNNCIKSDSLMVDTCPKNIIIPNVFTPNGDQINDEFRYQNAEDWEFTTQIFNRWGALIYSNSESKFWDGNYKGKEVPAGVYFFIVQAKAIKTGEIKSYKGSVTVVRE